jgi:uncharacterized membrane protein
MNKGRFEAFSDGVIAVIITIIVLEMKVPHGESIQALVPLVPVFLSYVLSFVYVGIYWNNHHHMLHATSEVTGRAKYCQSYAIAIPMAFVSRWVSLGHYLFVALVWLTPDKHIEKVLPRK